MSRPDCFVAGFYKCGTTTLYMMLRQHQNILVSDEKENYFFRNRSIYKKGILWYQKQYYNFKKNNNKDIILEVNPGLSETTGTARRLRKFYPPETPIIFIMRNPVDWLYSHFRFEIRRGAFPLKDIWFCKKYSFSEGFERYLSDQIAKHIEYQHIFSQQIKEYKKYFTNINYIFLEDLQTNADGVYREILRFFGLDYDDGVNIEIKANTTDFIPKYPLLKKFHLFLKLYNRKIKLKRNKLILKGWSCITTCIEQKLINFIEFTKIEDKSKMKEITRRKLERYFQREKEYLEDLTGRNLKEIWW